MTTIIYKKIKIKLFYNHQYTTIIIFLIIQGCLYILLYYLLFTSIVFKNIYDETIQKLNVNKYLSYG